MSIEYIENKTNKLDWKEFAAAIYAEFTKDRGTRTYDEPEAMVAVGDCFNGATYEINGAKVSFVCQEGGGEGGTEYCYSVFNIDGELYMIEYSYYSYEGFQTEYIQEMVKVEAYTKQVTCYRRVS